MTEWQCSAEQNSGKLKITAAMTILHVAPLKTALIDAFAQVDRVDVDLSTLAEVDVAGLQLLCAAHRYAAGRNQQLAVTVADNRVVLDLVRDAGLSHGLFDGVDQGPAA